MKTQGILQRKRGYGDAEISETQEIQLCQYEKAKVEHKNTDVG